MDEKLDVVDASDNPIGITTRGAVKADFVNTRFSNIFIRNMHGQFWIPKRKSTLKRWAGGLDFSVGGAVEAGESYEQAAIREAKEELDLTVKIDDLTEVAYLSPHKYPVACFSKTFEIILDSEPNFTPEEFDSGQWYDLQELVQILSASNLPSKTDLLPIIRLCYGTLSKLDRSQFRPDL